MAWQPGTRVQLNKRSTHQSVVLVRGCPSSTSPGMVTVMQEITKTRVVYLKQRGAWKGPGKSLWLGSTGWWGTNVLHLTERLKDSPGQGRNRFYTTGRWRMWQHHTVYVTYQGFGMMRLTSHPGQWLLAGNCQLMLFQPITAKPEVGKGCNQGWWPWLLEHQHFWCIKVRACHFTVTLSPRLMPNAL